MLKAAMMIGSLACAAAAAHAQDEPKPPADITPDRYQIVFTPDVPADAMLLDTSTGRIWRMTHMPELKGEPDVWMYMSRVDSEAERVALFAEHGKKPPPAVPVAKPPAAGLVRSHQ